jgi:hypothetical protein
VCPGSREAAWPRRGLTRARLPGGGGAPRRPPPPPPVSGGIRLRLGRSKGQPLDSNRQEPSRDGPGEVRAWDSCDEEAKGAYGE